MEKEDKLIRELLNQSFSEKAPEDFTQRVMLAVEQVELSKKTSNFPSLQLFVLLSVFSFLLAFAVFFIFDQNLLMDYYLYFTDYVTKQTLGFTQMFKSFSLLKPGYSAFELTIGIGLIIFSLLFIEKLIGNKKPYTNLIL